MLRESSVPIILPPDQYKRITGSCRKERHFQLRQDLCIAIATPNRSLFYIPSFPLNTKGNIVPFMISIKSSVRPSNNHHLLVRPAIIFANYQPLSLKKFGSNRISHPIQFIINLTVLQAAAMSSVATIVCSQLKSPHAFH